MVLGAEHEVVRVPACGDGHTGATTGDAIDDRPLLGDAGRVMQWQDAATGAQRHVARDRGEGGAGDRRVRERPAECIEVPFRGPDRHEASLVSEAGGVEQDLVLASALGAFAAEEEQAHVEPSRTATRVPSGRMAARPS